MDVALDASTVGLEIAMGLSARSKFNTCLLAFAVVVFNSLGNLLLAWGMKHSAQPVGLDPLSYLRAMLTPFVAAGIALLILWLLTRMALMSWADLSFALPLTGLGYVLATVFGKVFLNEVVTAKHWTGTLMIFAGVVIVGTTTHQTALRDNAA